MSVNLTPIGHIKSMFHSKNGTPRQSGLIKSARASLTINKAVFNNPEHSLEDVSSFSHVWLIWLFHANGVTASVKAKVAPPRLKGRRVGVFSTRSPHRPCPIGLTLAKVERVEGATVTLSGIDLIDGTPVLDLKPYIPQYDSVGDNMNSLCDGNDKDEEIHVLEAGMEEVSDETAAVIPGLDENAIEDPHNLPYECQKQHHAIRDKHKSEFNTSGELKNDNFKVKVPEWVGDPKDDLIVGFTDRALKDLETLDETKLEWLESRCQLKNAITEILVQDPRSVYRRHECSDRLYYTQVDTAHVTAWFDDTVNTVEVLRIKYKNDSN